MNLHSSLVFCLGLLFMIKIDSCPYPAPQKVETPSALNAEFSSPTLRCPYVLSASTPYLLLAVSSQNWKSRFCKVHANSFKCSDEKLARPVFFFSCLCLLLCNDKLLLKIMALLKKKIKKSIMKCCNMLAYIHVVCANFLNLC